MKKDSANMKISAFLVSFILFAVNVRSVDIETVKSFLSESPCYGLIEYDVTDNQTGRVVNKYQARICGDNFVLVDTIKGGHIDKLISRETGSRAHMICGRSESGSWIINGHGYGLSRSGAPNVPSPDPTTSFVDHRYHFICELLTFGSQTTVPGSFVWDGNQFDSRPIQSEFGLQHWYSGTLDKIDENTFQIKSGSHGYNYIIYDDANRLPDGWPNEIRIHCRNMDECMRTIRITSVKEGIEGVSEPFDPYSYIDREIAIQTEYSEAGLPVPQQLSGVQVELIERDLRASKRMHNVRKYAPIILLTAFFAIGFGWWLKTR